MTKFTLAGLLTGHRPGRARQIVFQYSAETEHFDAAVVAAGPIETHRTRRAAQVLHNSKEVHRVATASQSSARLSTC